MTNFGAGCRVHCGGIELADVCRVKAGRFFGKEVVVGTLLLGGISGGGPLPMLDIEHCGWILGGTFGRFSFVCSDEGGDFEVMLEVLWSIADFALDMVCTMEICVGFAWEKTVEVNVVGAGNSALTIGFTISWDVLSIDFAFWAIKKYIKIQLLNNFDYKFKF